MFVLKIFNALGIYFLVLGFSCGVYAQQPLILNHLGVEDGLSQSAVISIAQDKQGFMWFGTKDGLNKYNGNTFKVYRTSEREKDYILALHASRNGDLWIGSKNGLRKYNPVTDSFIDINSVNDKYGLQKGEAVNCIFESVEGKVWAGTQNGLYHFNPNQLNKIEKLLIRNEKVDFGEIYAIYQDTLKNIWAGGRYGLFRIKTTGNSYEIIKYKVSAGLNDITSITGDDKGNLWISRQNGGVVFFNSKQNSFKHYFFDAKNRNSLTDNNVRRVIVDKKGEVWMGTLKGLSVFDPQKNTFTSFKHNSGDAFSLNQNSIYDIYQDRQGSVWIGTYYGSINVAYSKNTPFKKYQATNSYNSISSNIVSAIIEDEKHNLWIGTEAEGLNYLDRETGKFTYFKNGNQSLSSNLVKSIYKDKKGEIWVGLYGGGLNLLNKNGKSFTHYRAQKNIKGTLSSDNVSAILEDKRGRFWVGTMGGGLNLFDRVTQKSIVYTDTNKTNALSSNWVKVIFEDSRQNLWIGTLNGLNLLEKGKEKFQWILQDSSKYGLKSNYINAITESSDGSIWIGTTHGGLGEFKPKNKQIKFYTTSDGLISNNINSIVEDHEHHLWLSTDKGISKFDRSKRIIRNYNRRDGLPGNEFNTNSSLITKSGEIFFGSLNGLISFNPALIEETDFFYPTIFTGLKLFNKTVSVNDGTNILQKDISYSNELQLKYDQNTFSIEFAVLNFIKSDKNRYAYKLDNFDKDWIYTSNPLVSYTNLPSGKYNLLVKSANNDGIWNSTPSTLFIQVYPPFWKTWWAYLSYILFFAFILYLIIKFFRERAKLERDLYYEHLENQRQQEFYQMKLDLFTNISHELRTPLTLIKGPLEKAIELLPKDLSAQSYLLSASKNAAKLMQLVNEFMDFRKAESGHLKLNLVADNLTDIAREVYGFFMFEAETRNISYVFEATENEILVNVERHQFEKVIFNLLSNAFKFVPDFGRIKLQIIVENEFAVISVFDNGPGIPKENQPLLFNNFYQVASVKNLKNSSGVGLALAKAITELHMGEIELHSDADNKIEDYQTEFKVKLPLLDVKQDGLVVKQSEFKEIKEETIFINGHAKADVELDGDLEKPIVLLVEDNNEVRDFIKKSIIDDYQVLVAADGKQGLKLAEQNIPDIIVSDVMMPEMDGLEFCKQIKSGEVTAHIPVILLTARGAHEHQVDGLETGADVYITKPFSTKLLLLNMHNLLASREAMRQKFSRQIILEPQNLEISSTDEKFLKKVMAIIDAKMEDPQFGVADLMIEAGISKNVLYRKLNALTGLSPGDFIKSIRLKRAAILFAQGKFSVADVTFSIGFNDPKYFGKEFKKHFGKSPSEYMADNKIIES
jgi:ligand-binding sensor domain-containing protein/signal transduction histidine kinase/DNA-binding response OmpR family regulator